MNEAGNDLIFLISQPRSGSTLLQNMLRGHPRIHTLPEPWFMLHLLYGYRGEGLAAEFDAGTANRALLGYLAATGGGRALYVASVRAAARELYERARQTSGKDLFLDKTPRYYHVITELHEVFPEARFIFLIRNPMAVLASILGMVDGDWTALRRLDRMHDLVTAPRNIAHAVATFTGRFSVVHYEELVEDSEAVLSAVLRDLELEQVPGLTTYEALESTWGDRKSIAKHTSAVREYVDRWHVELGSRGMNDLAVSYLNELGQNLVEKLGYSYRDLTDELRSHHWDGRRRAGRWRLLRTPNEELQWWQRLRLSFDRSKHQRGALRTLVRYAYIVIFGHAPQPRGDRDHVDSRPV
jgi:hypothetical protein